MNAYLVAYGRSPFHFARKGSLAEVRPDDLAAHVASTLLQRLDLDPALIEDVILGCAYPEAEQGDNLAKIVAMRAGLPESVAGMTVNRFCGSSMSAVHIAAGSIATGAGEAFLCLGVESMSRVPQGGFNPSPNPTLLESYPQAYISMGLTAENVAARFDVSRDDQEVFALQSHHKAAAAAHQGHMADELIPLALENGTLLNSDGCIRPNTSLEALAQLKPAFRDDGVVTAGTSSPLTDGASAVLVASEEFVARNGLTPLARIRAAAVAGCPPEVMGMGPVPATRKVLARAGLSIDDIGVVELNEAFASQALACVRELGIDPTTLNIDGGALALGHPLGATGARLTGKAAALLARTKTKYALATQCIGGGQGIATILEAV
ncbi:MAG TPA: thiolase family protein [Gammaproteobacteria bacterium]|nr:thiolase family protein [Gammaproteobacteria bacterium]